ncbi:MAG TPA: VacB/RNase II family 3'-5' exoribonuclease [Candidatus Eisenbacteria bacterium]|nr:VacB/RNase II family 3'-5' exoribonuclease [Candidatus Eisenbacteria bacterium]
MSARTQVGRLERTRFGYGFVRLEDGGEDLFIPPFAMGGAFHGDRVRVGYLDSGPQGDAHEVLEILERTKYGILGRFEGRGRNALLLPERPEYPREILLTLHGRARIPPRTRVLVRLTPTPPEPLVGTVEAVFADDDPREDSWIVALEEGIRTEFDPEAEREAAAFREDSVAHAIRGRTDFRASRVLTIDPADAKDHDDALSIEATNGGVTTVGIHIADVTHYVRPGTALDTEARERGTSVYLADTTYPMLPEALSSTLCSLTEGDDRLTVSVLADIAENGALVGARVVEGVIRSAASLSYPEAHRILREESGETAVALRTLDGLANALRERRFEKGGLELDLPEIKPELDAQGDPVRFDETPRLPTHGLIEEFMLLANQIVGQRAHERELPFLYRVHERPRYDKLRSFFEAARYLGKQGPAQIVTDARQLRRWISHGRAPKDRLLNLYLLRALEKARYDLVDVGHFGLGMAGYAHFTSPIRRYPDLANHRIVKRFLLEGHPRAGGDPWAFAGEWLNASVAGRATEAEIAADDAERDVEKRKAVRFALQRLGEEARGMIVGLTPNGLFVRIPDWNIEGFLPKRALGDPSLSLAEHGFSFRSKRSRHRFGLGDAITVMVSRADLDRREVELGLVPHAGGGPRQKRRAQGKRAVHRRPKGRR